MQSGGRVAQLIVQNGEAQLILQNGDGVAQLIAQNGGGVPQISGRDRRPRSIIWTTPLVADYDHGGKQVVKIKSYMCLMCPVILSSYKL